MDWKKNNYFITDDSNQYDLEAIHHFLTNCYWAQGRSKEVIAESIRNSFTLGLFRDEEQVGFARVITDYCTFAYLCDVYVLEAHRKNGLGHFLMECIFQHPKLASVKWLLKTTSAQSLYRDFGFNDLESPLGWMMRKPTSP